MMAERGVAVDHVTLCRRVQRYAPELEKRVRWYQGYRSSSWRVDSGWAAMLSDRRNTKAARRFLAKALKVMRTWPPVSITTDKLGLKRPTRGFQSMKTAYATIKGFEIMRMIRRRHCMLIEPGVTGEVRFVNKL
jgi:transposase, IS6 family